MSERPSSPRREVVEIELVGRNSAIFNRLFDRLSAAIESAVELISQDGVSEGTKETIADLVQLSQDFVQAKLQKPSIENQKILSEIALEYAAAEEKLASARKIQAEIESVNLENAINRLRYAMEAISIIKQIKLDMAGGGSALIIDASDDKQDC